MQRSWLWPIAIICLSIAALISIVKFSGTPVSLLFVLGFLCICPGMMLVRFMRLDSIAAEWTLALALSLAIDGIIAGIYLYAGRWSPPGIFATIFVLSIAGACIQLFTLLEQSHGAPMTIAGTPPAALANNMAVESQFLRQMIMAESAFHPEMGAASVEIHKKESIIQGEIGSPRRSKDVAISDHLTQFAGSMRIDKRMQDQQEAILGIDLGTTYACIAYVDTSGKAVMLPNREHQLATPAVVLFEGQKRIVGDEAKNSALLTPDTVVEMVKRHMGEANWRFRYEDKDYAPEEISSYILRKLAADAQEVLGFPVNDVVITCPAYFGLAQREATARAGEIAGLNVQEVLSEPTAAAIAYGLQYTHEQTVLVYDLGGGTFDITIIALKRDETTVIATGGDHHLGGRDWDSTLVSYLAQQWQEQTESAEDPLETPETLQDLWLKAEKAKWALTARLETRVAVSHGGRNVKVVVTRDKFNELTASLLDRTILFTRMTMDAAKVRGYSQFDQIVLVGGSTRMPQVSQRLEQEFRIPHRLFEPDEAVAKGAALYGQRLLLQKNIQAKATEIAYTSASGLPTLQQTAADSISLEPISPAIVTQARKEITQAFGREEMSMQKLATTEITNVVSHSFGIVVTIDYGTARMREAVSNLVRVNDPLPITKVKTYGTLEADQDDVEITIVENAEETAIVEQEKYDEEAVIGTIILHLPSGLPADAPIDVSFEINGQGLLHVTGREPSSDVIVEAEFETKSISRVELREAKSRALRLTVH